jgi:GNAT superfamily N-acetyltransferase
VQQYWPTDSTQYTFKCVDGETGEIAGMALYDIYLTPSKWRRGEISWLSGEERERADALITPLWDARENLWLDERYIYCHVMAVHPKYQRKGVGQLLMEYVIGIAQQVELPIYIESSEEGTRLYEKMACRRVKQSSKDKPVDPATREKDNIGKGKELALFVWLPKGGEGKLPKSVQLL